MEATGSVARFSSCRGVSFEISSGKTESFYVSSGEEEASNEEFKWWHRWSSRRSSFQVFPVSHPIQRSSSLASSHFCDVEDDDGNTNDDDDIEKGKEEEGAAAQQNNEKKRQKQSSSSRLSVILLDQGLFTVYKRLFVFFLAANLVALALAAAGNFPYGRRKPAVLSMANILLLTLCRSEAFLRLVFFLAVELLGRPAVPLPLKTAATSLLQSLGGVHSGCGVSALAWLAYSVFTAVWSSEADETLNFVNGVGVAILALLLISAMAAFPLLRHLHHNAFELAHRFAGWSALGLLWIFVLLSLSYDLTNLSFDHAASMLARHPELYLTAAITLLILLPWLTVRRVPVDVTTPSGHAAIIKFAGGVSPGILGRISRSPLLEWHAFGIISDGENGHMMLAGAVGDFTRSLVSDPPTHLWVRSLHFAGLPYLVNMYERVVLVATGSGLCVFLSFLLQPCRADVHLVWVAKEIEKNYGEEVVEMVRSYPKEKVVVHDTAVGGRPDVAEMSVAAARRWGAEVVVVTSNPAGSRDVVSACKGAGIPAFGPIWDS